MPLSKVSSLVDPSVKGIDRKDRHDGPCTEQLQLLRQSKSKGCKVAELGIAQSRDGNLDPLQQSARRAPIVIGSVLLQLERGEEELGIARRPAEAEGAGDKVHALPRRHVLEGQLLHVDGIDRLLSIRSRQVLAQLGGKLPRRTSL